MITLVQARNVQGSLLDLPLDDTQDGFSLEEVGGLDPVNATIVSSSFAQLDGTQYESARRENRNLTLKIYLEPDYAVETVKDLRRRLYQFFMPKSAVDFILYDSDGLIVNISGRVESCQAPLFTSEPVMDVSVICFDPDFYESNPVTVAGTTVSTDVETLITYDGSVETGIDFTINPDRALTEFTIYHRPPDGTLRQLDFAGNLAAGDVLTISTHQGAKGAVLTSSGQDGSVLNNISPQSSWIELQPGDNHIRVYAEGAAIPFSLEFTNKYGGL